MPCIAAEWHSTHRTRESNRLRDSPSSFSGKRTQPLHMERLHFPEHFRVLCRLEQRSQSVGSDQTQPASGVATARSGPRYWLDDASSDDDGSSSVDTSSAGSPPASGSVSGHHNSPPAWISLRSLSASLSSHVVSSIVTVAGSATALLAAALGTASGGRRDTRRRVGGIALAEHASARKLEPLTRPWKR